jgi:CRP-like cAMP-binding protein
VGSPHREAPPVSVAAAAAGEHFWSALPPPDQAALLAAGATRQFLRGRALMHQGQAADEVLLLRTGQVKVYTTTASGREVVLAIRGPGELLGELAALDAQPRSASVMALEDGNALVLTAAAFRGFLAGHPAAAMAMLGMLTRRLRDADTKRTGFASQTTLGRVAERLLELADRFGVTEDRCVLIELRLSQEELAGWTGASLESVGRALATMRSLHWIETRRREIRIFDVEALRRAAQ